MRMLTPSPRELDDAGLRAAYAAEPGIRLGFIASADGASTLGGSSGALGGAGDHRVMLALREQADAVLVGAGTVRAEGYGDLGLSDAATARRLEAGRAPQPRLAIVTRGSAPDSSRALHPVVGGLSAVLAELRAAGLDRILCEGGPSLAGSLLAAGLVDELCLTVSPTLAGGDASRIIARAPEMAERMTLVHALEDDGFLFLRYAAIASRSSASRIV